MRIRVRRRAQLQIREARTWWAENRSDTPRAIERELEQTLARLSRFQFLGATVPQPRIEGIRRTYLRHVHYFLYYRVTSEAIEILAFWHASPWRSGTQAEERRRPSKPRRHPYVGCRGTVAAPRGEPGGWHGAA